MGLKSESPGQDHSRRRKPSDVSSASRLLELTENLAVDAGPYWSRADQPDQNDDVHSLAPGAEATAALSVNPESAVTGIYIDASIVLHGFLRYPDGTFATFDAPGAGSLAGQGTRPEIINPAGSIAGFYFDESDVSHGFLRIP